MENSNKDIVTPKHKVRCLGLRRSIQRPTIAKTPQSDLRINYNSLQNDCGTPSPSTPYTSQSIPPRAAATTATKCQPHRLSLSRRVRDTYKKKKLEFAASMFEADTHTSDTTPSSYIQENSQEVLLKDIAEKEALLNAHRKHIKRVQELKSLISIWTEGFKTSLEDLSSRIEPKMEMQELIARLGISSEMIEYT